jgi:flagellar assembly factor FliW
MMETSRKMTLGGLEFKEEDIIFFDNGLPGFEHLNRFVISTREEHAPFHWLHSLEDENLRFIMINPLQIKEDYDPRITKAHLNSIDVEERSDLLMYVLVTLNKEEFSKSTLNLLGPILVNIRTKKGLQVILDDSRYSVKHPVLGEAS